MYWFNEPSQTWAYIAKFLFYYKWSRGKISISIKNSLQLSLSRGKAKLRVLYAKLFDHAKKLHENDIFFPTSLKFHLKDSHY